MDLNDSVLKLWDFIEKQLDNCTIPNYLKNILYLCGCDNIFSIKTISQSDIDTMQEFARTKMKEYVRQDCSASDYYHIFAATPEKFVFPPGHLKLLQEIIKLLNSDNFKSAYSKIKATEKRQVRDHAAGSSKTNESVLPLLESGSQLEQDGGIANSTMEEFSQNFGENERQNLFQKIVTWFENNCTRILEQHSNEINLNMILTNAEKDSKTNITKMVVKVKCPACTSKIKAADVKKILAKGNQASYTSIQNFTRHVQEKHKNELNVKREITSPEVLEAIDESAIANTIDSDEGMPADDLPSLLTSLESAEPNEASIDTAVVTSFDKNVDFQIGSIVDLIYVNAENTANPILLIDESLTAPPLEESKTMVNSNSSCEQVAVDEDINFNHDDLKAFQDSQNDNVIGSSPERLSKIETRNLRKSSRKSQLKRLSEETKADNPNYKPKIHRM